MAATCDTKETTISNLPPEMLSHIFTFLPRNLRVVRLVCSEWNELCNTEKVSGNEKIVISSSNIDDFFNSRTLLRRIYNLNLQGLYFEIHHVSFFEKYGGKLRSLTLECCNARDGYVPFLPFCKNLNTLLLDSCSWDIVQSFCCLDGSFVQTNIVSLEIGYSVTWSDETIDGCFRICPHLRSLSLRDDSDEDLYGSADISFDCIYGALSLRAANIVELSFNGIIPDCEDIERIVSIPDLRLRTLKISIASLTQRIMCNIVTRQPDLQIITIDHCSGIVVDGSADWIGSCSKLTHLTILHWAKEIVLHRKLLDALTSRSHLRELVLGEGLVSIARSDFENSQGTFKHLRAIELDILYVDVDCFLEKVSANLNRLNLTNMEGIPSETLEFISHRFTNLEILEFKMDFEYLTECEYHDDYDFDRISLNFEKLKNLRIWACHKGLYLSEFLMRFKAPNLQYLKLFRFDAIDATAMSNILENFPSLECFELSKLDRKVDPLNPRVISDRRRLSFFYVNDVEYLQLHRSDPTV